MGEEVDGGAVGVPEMHCPLHGRPVIEVMVGVQCELGRQGRSLPMVHGMTGGGVGESIQRPPHGFPDVHTIVGVQCHDVGHGLSFPIVHGTVYLGGGMVVVMTGGLVHAQARAGRERSARSAMVIGS